MRIAINVLALLSSFAMAGVTMANDPNGGGAASDPPATGKVDISNAKPMPLPQSERKESIDTEFSHISVKDFGDALLTFSTARADAPSSAVGKFWACEQPGGQCVSYQYSTCTASLIKPGIALTAAHCVTAFGTQKRFTPMFFAPGFNNGSEPFGQWDIQGVEVPLSYDNGTDSCSDPKIICANDVALIILAPQKGKYPGDEVGYFAFGYDGAGFTDRSNGFTHLTALGYPGCLDNGGVLERNDAQGSISPANSNNTLYGSLMCQGDSGGPLVINYGSEPVLTPIVQNPPQPGFAPFRNMIVGVTSWGRRGSYTLREGASPFTQANVVSLMTTACSKYPGACGNGDGKITIESVRWGAGTDPNHYSTTVATASLKNRCDGQKQCNPVVNTTYLGADPWIGQTKMATYIWTCGDGKAKYGGNAVDNVTVHLQCW